MAGPNRHLVKFSLPRVTHSTTDFGTGDLSVCKFYHGNTPFGMGGISVGCKRNSIFWQFTFRIRIFAFRITHLVFAVACKDDGSLIQDRLARYLRMVTRTEKRNRALCNSACRQDLHQCPGSRCDAKDTRPRISIVFQLFDSRR